MFKVFFSTPALIADIICMKYNMKQYIHLTNFMLIALISYLGVTFFYKGITAAFAITASSGYVFEADALTDETSRIVRPVSYYKAISERDLFHTQARQASVAPDPVEQLKQTELNLKLWGTVNTGKGTRFAVIEGGAEKSAGFAHPGQMLYHEGDTVAGALIKQILDERVILSINGEKELLALEEFRSQSRRRGYVRNRSARRPIRQVRRLRRSQVDDAFNNINDLMKQAYARPHRDGIQVVRIKQGSFFRRLGLRNGDIITGVNGQEIRSVQDALGLYENLRSSDNVNVQFKRRGRDWSIRYKIM